MLAIPAERLEAFAAKRLGRLTVLTAISATKGLPKPVTNRAGPVPHGSDAVMARPHTFDENGVYRVTLKFGAGGHYHP
jgi:hypothetical protein